MPILNLKRLISNMECVLGVLIYNQKPIASTLERPWIDNIRNQSCIPAGLYNCEPYQSNRFGNTYKICNVSGRSHILFHAGNVAQDTEGCILLGDKFGVLKNRQAVLNSRKCMLNFMKHMKNQEFLIRILDI